MTTTWHEANTGNDQGLIIDDETGRNVAVSYEAKDAKLIAAAPELLKFAQDILRYLDVGGITTKADKKFVKDMAWEVVYKATEG